MSLYFDHAAATPMDPAVLEAMVPFMMEQFYNPSAIYNDAQKVKRAFEKARTSVAAVLGCKPVEIIWTAGGTEANNLAIVGIMQNHPDGHIVVGALEHDAVLAPASAYPHDIVSANKQGIISVEHLKQVLTPQTVLVSVMYANNEIGTVQPIREVAQVITDERKRRQTAGSKTPIYFHTDACQAANTLDLHVNSLGVDLLTLNGGKIYGPKQSGILFVKSGVPLQPLIKGGGQERGFRSGTENVAAAIGFAEALGLAQEMRRQESLRLKSLQEKCFSWADGRKDVTVNGSRKNRLPNNVHLTFAGRDNERLLYELDGKGIMAAAGSACSASSDEPSHVLKAIGFSDEQARSSLRFTFGRSTSPSDVETLLHELDDVLAT